MNLKRTIITKNDFIIKFDEKTKLYTAALIFGVKMTDDLEGGYLRPFGQMRVFKGTGNTNRVAIRNAIRELENSLLDIKRYI